MNEINLRPVIKIGDKVKIINPLTKLVKSLVGLVLIVRNVEKDNYHYVFHCSYRDKKGKWWRFELYDIELEKA